MALVKWNQLTQSAQRDVRRSYVHWQYDPTSATFEAWAEKHAFYVREDGQLDKQYQRCEPSFMAEGSE